MIEEDPCNPNPCGPNTNPPKNIGDRCQCTCLPGMIGSPPNCRDECVINADCPTEKACNNRKCQDPCPGLCGVNAKCIVRKHIPICKCMPGFVGNPFSQCNRPKRKRYDFELFFRTNLNNFVATPRPFEVIEPCNPSPCGSNAICNERGNAASCKCILDYIGNPYIECKPECTINSECPRDKACVTNKCKDPCPGICGAKASCTVRSHIPQCTCDPGYSGNAFIACTRVTTCKFCLLDLVIIWNGMLM